MKSTQETRPTTVLFLHGFLGCGADWAPIIEGLGAEFHCIAPDLPGHGGATLDALAGKCGFIATAKALLKRLDKEQVPQCALVGYSMGGRIALYLALRYPHRFPRVALESASPGLREESERAPRREQDEALARRLETMDDAKFRAFLEEWYGQPLFASLAQHPALRAGLIERRMRNSPAALAAALRGMGLAAQPSLWAALPDFRTPALLIVGSRDRKFCPIAERMSEYRSNIAVHEMADCGHNVHLENPSGYTTVLKRFLESATHI
jgi:2-succinyl-6-hydroxy-2,4-cyclohexadiene-1-carboxylate synthase